MHNVFAYVCILSVRQKCHWTSCCNSLMHCAFSPAWMHEIHFKRAIYCLQDFLLMSLEAGLSDFGHYKIFLSVFFISWQSIKHFSKEHRMLKMFNWSFFSSCSGKLLLWHYTKCILNSFVNFHNYTFQKHEDRNEYFYSPGMH